VVTKVSMFRRSKSESATNGSAEAAQEKVGGKGRPTPKRKEAEAAAKARAKAASGRGGDKKATREARAEHSRKIRNAMKTGDERYFLPRDQGPVRRFIRDYVDSRFSIVEMLIPLLVISMILGWTGQPALMQASSLVLLATVLFVVFDLIMLRFRLRRELARRFPDDTLKGTTYYACMRALQMKFMRMPKSQVKIGQTLPEHYK
jgi:hypothetical protein